MLKVKFKLFSDRGREPTYGRPGDACLDLYAANVGDGPIWQLETRKIYLDIGMEIPPGYEGQVRPRSGRSGEGLLVHFGTVDETFRGNVGVNVTNLSREPYVIKVGERVAQLAIRPVGKEPGDRFEFELAEQLAESVRGAEGWGSSGR